MQGRSHLGPTLRKAPPVKLAALLNSNALWARSGYGTQSRQLLTRMAKDGHAVAVCANYGLEGTVTDWDGIPHFPRGNDAYSNDVVGAYYQDWTQRHRDKSPLLMTLYDVWVLNSTVYDQAKVLSWVPIDGAPVAAPVAEFLRKPNVHPVAMSKFGAEQMTEAGIDCFYVPHAIDTDVFKRTETVDIAAQGPMTGRQIMGVESDQFVVGAFNANSDSRPSRKAWPEQLLAFSIFAKDHDDAVLYIHTDRHGAGANGLKMDELCAAVGLKEHQFKFVNQYAYRSGIPQEGLAALMSACDVGLAASYGEGFGLTVLEFQSCGVRVVANDFSAQPELVGDGWLTAGQPFYNPGFQNWWKAPSIGSIVESLERAYAAPRGHSDKARAHAVQYDADLVYRQRWRPVLEAMAK